MAPRKTTKTPAVDPVREAAGLDKGAPEAAEPKVENTVTLNVAGVAKEVFDLEVRFQVALAVFPTIIGMGVAEPLEDENLAGASARSAFEYADAFIAQSKKGEYDAG